jgi:hypothetical protein
MKRIRWFICLTVIAFLGVLATAQTPTGTIQGVVTDKTGAAIQGASISIVRTETNETHKTTSDTGGRYTIPFVQPGNYTVIVEVAGFRPAKQNNIQVEVAGTRPVDFKLDVGTVTQTVEVSATTENLDTETSSLGETIQTQMITDLPDNGRNPFDFATLVPGVNNVGSASTPHIGGSRNGNNEQQIDGMTNILPENNVGNNSSAYQPVMDSVEEVNVQTSVLAAEFGRFSGGTISLITKSGTNQLHGSFFGYASLSDRRHYRRSSCCSRLQRPQQELLLLRLREVERDGWNNRYLLSAADCVGKGRLYRALRLHNARSLRPLYGG